MLSLRRRHQCRKTSNVAQAGAGSPRRMVQYRPNSSGLGPVPSYYSRRAIGDLTKPTSYGQTLHYRWQLNRTVNIGTFVFFRNAGAWTASN